jgi:ssDNA-binding Zn-finger/Zn-ribbon topoisomerase 1
MRLLSWRERQTKFRKRDPLICPLCGKEMILKEMAFWSFLGELVVIPVN